MRLRNICPARFLALFGFLEMASTPAANIKTVILAIGENDSSRRRIVARKPAQPVGATYYHQLKNRHPRHWRE
jgi:hypothetical protein